MMSETEIPNTYFTSPVGGDDGTKPSDARKTGFITSKLSDGADVFNIRLAKNKPVHLSNVLVTEGNVNGKLFILRACELEIYPYIRSTAAVNFINHILQYMMSKCNSQAARSSS